MYRKTADEIMELNPEIAIIPVGSLEQHGPHLPVMTDWAIATELGKRVAERMNAFLLPALPISTCREHMGKKGSVWMEPLTFYQMMTDIIQNKVLVEILHTVRMKTDQLLDCTDQFFFHW